MIKLVQPQITDLKYRKKLLKDKKTMAFNKINGGTVDFNEKIWKYDTALLRLTDTTLHELSQLVYVGRILWNDSSLCSTGDS